MQITIDVTWRPLEDSVSQFISEPNQSAILQFLAEQETVLKQPFGSTNNHQAWLGGWWDHIADGLSIAPPLYAFLSALRPLPFSLESGMLGYFGHDLEKPYAYEIIDGERVRKLEFRDKEQVQQFRELKLAEIEVFLTPLELNSIEFAEGELDKYTNKQRMMSELAGFVHMLDTASARIFHDYPKPLGEDDWHGACRIQTT